ncbi:alcohol dehydrogenase catalytic domain-containing protein [Erythrobacter aureus]|nr:alcohol dehydrogenase catalytic domain-containing protein [Erythrobacter aureus]
MMDPSMRSWVFLEPGKLELREVDTPFIEDENEAIVRPLVMGRCDLDRLYMRGYLPMGSGEPIGHEIIGEIVDLGTLAEAGFARGDRVIVSAQISCGSCDMCRTGNSGRCRSVPFAASYGMGREGGYGGGLSDYIKVPFAKAMMVPLPEQLDAGQSIGLADMASDAWRSVGPPLKERPGASVLVLGGLVPVIGIYAAAIAMRSGAAGVLYCDPDPANREAAALYGVDTASAPDSLSNEPAFDVIVDASGNREWLRKAFELVKPAGTITGVAPDFVSGELPLMQAYQKGVSFELGRPNCREGIPPAISTHLHCGFDPSLVGPRLFSFEEAGEAWASDNLYVAVEASKQ